MHIYFFILFFLIGNIAFSQIQDTIFFDKNWQPTVSNNSKYYRVFQVNDTVIKVVDYYKNGKVQMTGAYKIPQQDISFFEYMYNSLGVGHEVGEFTYYKKNGRKIGITLYDPINNMNNRVLKNYNILEFPDSVKRRLTYSEIYFNKGNIKEKGFYIDELYKHGKWFRYNRDSSLFYTVDYKYDLADGKQIIYSYDGDLSETIEFKDNLWSGENIFYDWDGNPKKRKIYKNGKLISKEKLK